MRNLIYIFVGSVLLSSCSIQRRLYVPTQVNNPYLVKAGDYSGSATYSDPSGFDINGGVAITNRIAVIGGYNNYKNEDEETESLLFGNSTKYSLLSYKHSGFHAGLGTFFPVSRNNPVVTVSVFAGIINNQFRMTERLTETFSSPSSSITQNIFFNSNIKRWFLQAGVNLYPGDFQFSFTSRYNYAGYENVKTDYTSNEQIAYNLPPFAYPKWSSFLDFSFDASYFFNKSKTLGVQLFSVASLRVNRQEFNFYQYPFRAGIGLVVKRPEKKKK